MKIVKILIGLLVVVAVVFGAVTLVKKRQETDKKEKTAIVYPIIVKKFITKNSNIILTLPYIAEVKSSKDIVVNSKFAGKLLFVKKLGDKVKKGDIIAKIDASDLDAKLEEIKTKISSLENKLKAEKISLNNLFATHKRTKALLDVKMASIEEYQNEASKIASLKAQIKADQNNIKALQATKKSIVNNLTYTDIKSSIDGIISSKFANIGDNIFPGKPILKISSKNGNYLFITLAEPKKEIEYKNKIYTLIPLNVSINGLLAYKVKVDDPSLINGEKVNVQVVEFRGSGIKLPYDAILSIDNKNFVFDTQGNPKEITIIAKGKNGVVVSGDIPNEVIVAKPDILLRIKAGYPVKVEK
jgi:multidrug efflux pump subunit AcrA (membrane-fusion protein)